VISVKVTNAGEVALAIEKAVTEAKQAVLDAYKGLSSITYRFVVRETPQWTGETVANWRFSFGSADSSSSSGIKAARKAATKANKGKQTGTVFHKEGFFGRGGGGNPAALNAAETSLRSRLNNIGFYGAGKALGLPVVYMTNNTEWDGGKGAYTVEALEWGDKSFLRQVNWDGRMMVRGVSYVSGSFKNIDAENLFVLRAEAKL
jgi:hypothetical protein